MRELVDQPMICRETEAFFHLKVGGSPLLGFSQKHPLFLFLPTQESAFISVQ